MKSFFDEIRLPTTRHFQMVGITDRVKESVRKSGIKTGIVVVFSQHTTCAIKINEHEKSLVEDVREFFEGMVPQNKGYRHNQTNVDGRLNAHSHLRSMLMCSSETIPLKNGKMMLGSWQTIFLVEVDGPRAERRVTVQVMGE